MHLILGAGWAHTTAGVYFGARIPISKMEVAPPSRLGGGGGALWCRVLLAKYGISDRLLGKRRDITGSVWWRDLWLASEGENNWFESCVCRRVGEGDSTLFWE